MRIEFIWIWGMCRIKLDLFSPIFIFVQPWRNRFYHSYNYIDKKKGCYVWESRGLLPIFGRSTFSRVVVEYLSEARTQTLFEKIKDKNVAHLMSNISCTLKNTKKKFLSLQKRHRMHPCVLIFHGTRRRSVINVCLNWKHKKKKH